MLSIVRRTRYSHDSTPIASSLVEKAGPQRRQPALDGLIVREASRGDVASLARLMTELGYPSSTADMGRNLVLYPGD
jgi:hypothetical protein